MDEQELTMKALEVEATLYKEAATALSKVLQNSLSESNTVIELLNLKLNKLQAELAGIRAGEASDTAGVVEEEEVLDIAE